MTTIRADLHGTRIDKDAEEPIYRQLIRIIRDQIATGTWHAGDRLPATRDLADELNISRISVVNAYAELRESGLLSAHTGRGTFVAGVSSREPRQLPANALSYVMSDFHLAPGVITFSIGTPAEEFLPVAATRQAMNAVLDRDGAAALNYEEMEGYQPLRSAIADFVAPSGITVRSGQVLITGGTQQAIDSTVQALCSENDTILTSNPTYLGVLDTARVRRVNVVGLPMDAHGLCLDQVERTIHDYHPKLIYVTPTHHNPTGTVMPIHRRRQLLELATHYRIPILEDAVYSELHYSSTPPPPIKALDTEGIVLYASGFSKILIPGLRIGFVIASGVLRERLLSVKSAADLCTPTLNQRTVHYYMETGALGGHLDRLRRACRERRDAAVNALRDCMPRGTHFEVPTGGVYLWVRLPVDGPSAQELHAAAVGHQVTFVVGSLFYTDSDKASGTHWIRLNFSAQPVDRIREGIRRIGTAWHALVASQTPSGGKPML